MRITPPTVLLATLFVAGCDSAPAPADKPPAAAPAPPPAAPAPSQEVVNKVLAPSPLEIEKEVREAGLGDNLADLVPKPTFTTAVDDKDRVALRTGVVIAYTVLAGRTTPKPEFLVQLRSVRAGMEALGSGKGLLATIDTFVQNVENDAASREDFLRELDGVAGNMVAEDGWGAGDRTGPLLQAGAWLAGTNLVAQAVVRADKADAADKLLRKPYVAEYFLGYLESSGAQKAGPTASTLADTLRTLREISNKPTIGVDDARAVTDATNALFAYL